MSTIGPGQPVQIAATRTALEQALQAFAAVVDAPGNLRLKATGTKGEIRAQFDLVDRARVYEAQHTQDANNGRWTSAGTFGSTRTVPGLTRGKDH